MMPIPAVASPTGGRAFHAAPGQRADAAGDALATMVDLAFPVEGDCLPRDHRRLLADAVERALPWLPATPGAGVHRINVVHGIGADVLLSRRTRLTLRVPRGCCDRFGGFRELDVGGHRLRLGEPVQRELLPHATLFAHLVAAERDDESAFLDAVDRTLDAVGVRCRRICGRRQCIDGRDGPLVGFSLMLYELAQADSLTLLTRGLGAHRRLGCGLFVPHKSAAAVGY